MNRKMKTKEEVSKTTPTEPTPSGSTKTFVKRIVDGGPYFNSSRMKYSMSSKDWSASFKDLKQMMSADQDLNSSIVSSRKER